jgi:hypothetical protein
MTGGQNQCIYTDGLHGACPRGAAIDGPADNRRSTGTSLDKPRGGDNFAMQWILAAIHRSTGTSPVVPVMLLNRAGHVDYWLLTTDH